MGMENDVMLSYFEDNERFADLFNFVYFDGAQVVKASELEEGSEVYTPKLQSKKRGKKSSGKPRIRDIKKRMKSGEELKILAVEAQSAVNYIMPWRCMDYDCREYGRQITRVQRANRRADESGAAVYADAGERLSEFCRTDKIAPVYTLCVYHGAEDWDGPRSLKDMMEFGSSRAWEQFFGDYPMRLVCVNEIKDFSGLKTEVRELFSLLPYRKNKEGLLKMLQENPEYQRMDKETAETISLLMGVEAFMEKEEKYREGEKYNMCQALRELMEDSRMEGLEVGRAEGHAAGLTEGHAAGLLVGIQVLIRENRDAGASEEKIVEKLQKYYSLSAEEAWERVRDFEELS